MRLLAKGFRPFFLVGAALAAVVTPLWLLVLGGAVAPPGTLTGVAWHAHEMIFGFTSAILAGFLLTAVANWTGRETATGRALGALVALWLLGRVAVFTGGAWFAAVDLAFLPLLAGIVARPLRLAGDRRGAMFPLLLLALSAADAVVHLDAAGLADGVASPALRAAVLVITMIILVIAGRIVPMFTHNATGADVRRAPALDGLAVASTGGLAVAALLPPSPWEAALAAVAAVAVWARARGWGAAATARDPLLWVLHAGHAWVAVGLALIAVAPLLPVARSLAIHALTVGAIGMLTLGMMARVALGHTGRPLRAPRLVGVAFGAVALAATARVFGPWLAPAWTSAWWWTAAGLWSAAFAVYVWVYAPILTGPRADGRPG